MDTHLDNELASGFTKDSPEAFAALYRLYYAPLCHFAEKFVINRDDAKDIVSDVFYHLWHKAPKVNKSVKAFLYAAVRNGCVDNLRKTKRLSKRNEELKYFLSEEQFDGEVIKNEVIKEVFAEIETLPPQRKQIFLLLYIDGLSYEQVARQLGLAEQTVRNQKQKAVLQLRKRMFPDELFISSGLLIGAASVMALIIVLLLYIRLAALGSNTWTFSPIC